MKIKGTKKGFKGTITVPGDKSISHRSVILGSLAEGVTKVHGFLPSDDCVNTLKNFTRMGVKIIQKSETELEVHGVGLQGLQKPNKALDVGNSGTCFRLMTGILAAQNFITKLTGDESIQKRPMKRVIEPLKKMGARFSGEAAPLIIFPGKLKGITYDMPMASAQVKSALLLAGLFTEQATTVIEPGPTRDHTERMFSGFGVELKVQPGTKKGSQKITLPAAKERKLKATDVDVPGDISSAAFFIVGALITPGSKLTIKNIGVNPTRTGLLDVLIAMGGNIKLKNKRVSGGEPIADLEITYSKLKGIEISGDTVVRMIDEIPIFSVAAALAKGTSIVRDAEELRVKESDRIKSIVEMLQAFGATITETPDGMIITGNPDLKVDKAIKVNSHFDHRIAMSTAVFGQLNKKETSITQDSCIATSFPSFVDILKKVTK